MKNHYFLKMWFLNNFFFFLRQVVEDALLDDRRNNSQDLSEDEENIQDLCKVVGKFWLPILFFLTVLTNLDNPFTILFIKLTLFLLSTKPNPFSVYVFVDQVRYFIDNTLKKCILNNILEFFCCHFSNCLKIFPKFISLGNLIWFGFTWQCSDLQINSCVAVVPTIYKRRY